MKDKIARQRIVEIVLSIVERPRRYTKKDLAEIYDVSVDTISADFDCIRNAGLMLANDAEYRYHFTDKKQYEKLSALLYFSHEDQAQLREAIHLLPVSDREKEALKTKLASLYDFRRLGYELLRAPHLDKIDQLEAAKAAKKQALLVNYHSSNSNSVRDRIVEPFMISPAEDTVQTYDVEKEVVNHFRISRAERVTVLEAPWQNEARHNNRAIDVFRIVENEQVMVHLRLSVGAYNELIERFPGAKRYVEKTGDPKLYDFQAPVNRKFLGLSNFILGFYHQGIEIASPDTLRAHLREVVAGLRF